MHTGSNQELRDKEAGAHRIAQQIANLLNQLDQIHPGSTAAHNGQISGLAITIRRDLDGQWTVRT